MQDESGYGRYRAWSMTLVGRLVVSLVAVGVLLAAGAPIALALFLGGLNAVAGLVAYKRGKMRLR